MLIWCLQYIQDDDDDFEDWWGLSTDIDDVILCFFWLIMNEYCRQKFVDKNIASVNLNVYNILFWYVGLNAYNIVGRLICKQIEYCI